MLSLSQTTGYAILALACMEGPGGKPVLVKNIAKATGIPRPYLAKLIHSLGQKEVVATKRGYKGGVTLAKEPYRITVLEVSDAVEGGGYLDGCLLGLEECTDERACPLHGFWKPTRERIRKQLAGKKLTEIAEFERGRRLISMAQIKSAEDSDGESN